MTQKRKIIYLEWDDSVSDSGWVDDSKVKTFLKPWLIHSVGYLVMENTSHISITTSIGNGGNKLDVLTIPKSSILKRRYLKA